MGSMKNKKMMPHCFFQGQFVHESEAKLSIASQSIQYGMTCFGGIRAYVSEGCVRLLRLKDHFNRLINGTKILGWDVDITYETFLNTIEKLVDLNDPKESFYIRPFFYTDNADLGPHFIDKEFSLAVYFVWLGQYFAADRGLKLMISSWRKFSDSSLPTKAKAGGCYINSALATTAARRAGYDDALMLDQTGNVVEASVANILISYRGEIYVPPAGSAVLDGLTMRSVIAILERAGKRVRRETIDRSMIYSADELLLTGTAAQVMFASSVDDRPIGDGTPGELCQLLRSSFAEVIEGKGAFGKEWITEIKPKGFASHACDPKQQTVKQV